MIAFNKSKQLNDEWQIERSIETKPPWMPNSQRPKDLKRSDKLLYSFKLNLNQSLNKRSQYNTNNNEMMTTLKRSNKISQSMIDDFKQSIPLNVIKMKESYKKMRKSESDLFNMYLYFYIYFFFSRNFSKSLMFLNSKLTDSSLTSYLNYNPELFKSRMTNDLYMAKPNLILISSKVACSYVCIYFF